MGIGLNLKRILRNQKMTIKQLSEISGISINTLYSITKRDSERIDPVLSQRIADALGIQDYELKDLWQRMDQFEVIAVGAKNIDGSPLSPESQTKINSILTETSLESYNKLPDSDKKEFWHVLLDDVLDTINDKGKTKLIEYALDLAKIPEYRYEVSPEPGTPTRDNTPSSADAPEGPQVGE